MIVLRRKFDERRMLLERIKFVKYYLNIAWNYEPGLGPGGKNVTFN